MGGGQCAAVGESNHIHGVIPEIAAVLVGDLLDIFGGTVKAVQLLSAEKMRIVNNAQLL